MYNLDVSATLEKAGFALPDIMAAQREAEAAGRSELGGWSIRCTDEGKIFCVHPSYNGIYVGDYTAHLIFTKTLWYSYGKYFCLTAKHRDLERVLATLSENKTNGYILCECDAHSFYRRKYQVEKLGYTVHHSNIEQCEYDSDTCYFLVA